MYMHTEYIHNICPTLCIFSVTPWKEELMTPAPVVGSSNHCNPSVIIGTTSQLSH